MRIKKKYPFQNMEVGLGSVKITTDYVYAFTSKQARAKRAKQLKQKHNNDLNISKPKKTAKKHWNVTLEMWEEKKKFLYIISYYKYSVRKPDQKIKVKYKLTRKGKLMKKPIKLSYPTIGKKEFQEVYNNNKWTIPENYKLDLTKN